MCGPGVRRGGSSGCAVLGLGEGEGEVEGGAFAFFAFCPDGAVVPVDDLFGDIEADSEAADSVLGLVYAVVAVEDIFEVFFGDADTAVADADDYVAGGGGVVGCGGFGLDGDGVVGAGVS